MSAHNRADGEIDRRPEESWKEFVKRLEATRLEVKAREREKEAESLEVVAKSRESPELEKAAKEKRVAAQEFRKALAKISKGAHP